MSVTIRILIIIFLGGLQICSMAQKGIQGCYGFDCKAKKWSIAQEYKKIRIGFGSGLVLTAKEGYVADGGILLSTEPAFYLRDDLTIGLRAEFAVTRLDLLYGSYNISSFSANSQYYFSNKKFRPMVGAGLGLFTVLDEYTQYHVNGDLKFGFYPRVGFDFGHFFLNLDYHLIPPSKNIYLDQVRNSYLGIRIGFFCGGGKSH